MKRVGNLWPSILERGNLVLAFHRAARSKRRKREVRDFQANLDEELTRMCEALLERRFEIGHFHTFKVHDPKERTIHAARFPERVFHHALMNLCEPVFERHLVHHTYACRKGKGRLDAIETASRAARRHPWYLKLDMRKYFESIPHDRLISRLQRLFKDREVIHWFERIIRSHHAVQARGVPIGSLTSQHFANFYLAPLDRLCMESPNTRAYARYMDDFVCWGSDKADLLNLGKQIQAYTEEVLGLNLKYPPSPQRSALGMDYLGYRIFPTHVGLNRRSKVRYRRKLKNLHILFTVGRMAEGQLQARLDALTAFTRPAASHHYRRRLLSDFRDEAIGHEPGEPGRLLEQQRQELPLREPQQEQPVQHEQQPGLPPRPQLRPQPPDGVIRLPSRD